MTIFKEKKLIWKNEMMMKMNGNEWLLHCNEMVWILIFLKFRYDLLVDPATSTLPEKNSNKSFTCVEKINAVNSSVLFELACDNFKKNTKKCHNFMEREGGELAQCLRHSNQTCWRDLPRVDQFIDVPCSCYHYNTG